MKRRMIISALLVSAAPLIAAADQVLAFPDGAVRALDKAGAGSYQLPLGPWQNGRIETLATEGQVRREVWRIPGGSRQTLGLLMPLKAQLETGGYEILFECETRSCGGFDFRFQTDVEAEPTMHVDLGDFRFLSARKGSGDDFSVVSILVSKSTERGFVQLTQVGALADEPGNIAASTKQPDQVVEPPETLSLSDLLDRNGSAVLEGLQFDKGSADLAGEVAPVLEELSAYLAADSTRRVILVGHTDAVGSLEGNIALSKQRANSVMRSLIDSYGVAAGQLAAEGIGFLAPRASNATEEGRELNRRVEVVLTSGT